jgi:hypothetical protein
MSATPMFSVTLKGLEETIGHVVALKDFKKLAKPAVQAALDKVVEAQRPRIKHGTGKAQASIGTHIHTAKWGVYGNAGPRGTSRFLEGYLAAKFLDSGTGLRGPLHRRVVAGAASHSKAHSPVFAFPAYTSTGTGGLTLFAERFGPKARSTTKRGRLNARRFGNLGLQFARSDIGMAPQPWAKGARAAADRPAQSAFAEAFWRGIAEASRA